MANPATTDTYTTPDGVECEVAIQPTNAGRWRVLDISEERTLLVETLTGSDDRQGQAMALAKDYATEAELYAWGRREHDPLPNPVVISQAPAEQLQLPAAA